MPDEDDAGGHTIIDELRTALRTQPMRYSSVKSHRHPCCEPAGCRALGISGPFVLGAWGRGVSQRVQSRSREMSHRGREDAVEADLSTNGRPCLDLWLQTRPAECPAASSQPRRPPSYNGQYSSQYSCTGSSHHPSHHCSWQQEVNGMRKHTRPFSREEQIFVRAETSGETGLFVWDCISAKPGWRFGQN